MKSKFTNMKIIDENYEELQKLCISHQVQKLFVFGSLVLGNFKPDSDIDFLVDFEDISLLDYADNYFDFKFSLEELLKRKIDLLEEKAIKNPFLRKSINSSRRIVYEQ